jgi:hypothetical protein
VAADIVSLGKGRLRRRVVVTFGLSAPAGAHLSDLLGSDVDLVDIKVSQGDEDIVLVSSTSRQLVGKLRAAFPGAAVLVVEVDDVEHGVHLGGQVLRTLDAGADGYFVARSVDELASIVGRASERIGRGEAVEQAALTAGEVDELSEVLDVLLAERVGQAAAHRAGAHERGDRA